MTKQEFVRLIQDNQGTIKSLCKIYYHCDEDRKDAFQDIVLQLWKSYGSFRGDSSIGTWVYRVSLNTILRKTRRKTVALEPLDSSDHYYSTALADDQVELLTLILQSLKAIDRAIVVLYLEGYQNKEIAGILDLSATNVSTRLNRVTNQLKKKFKTTTHAIK